MPNLYVSVTELRAAMPDGIRAATTKYDALMFRLAGEVSRWIDQECKRKFYPSLATHYFDGGGKPGLWVPDLLSITSISYSEDDGETYTALVAADYIATVAGDYNSLKSYTLLLINLNSDTLSYWPRGQRSVKIVGSWGYADDRDAAWGDTGDTVENNPLAAGGTSLTVNDVDGLDLYGAYARLQAGHLLKIESEYVETTLVIDTTANTIGITRAANGTTAAAHAQNTAISVWRPPEPVKQAAAIQVLRHVERGFQGFGDARAQPDVGQMFFFKQIDPEAAAKLAPYRMMEIP